MKNQIAKLSIPEYNAIQALRSSHLKEFIKSPAHLKYALDNPDSFKGDKKNLVLGSFVHALILEPETVKSSFAVVDVGSRIAKEYKQAAAIAYGQGKEVLLAAEEEQGRAIAAAALADPVFSAFLSQAYVEISAIAKISDVWVKARADMWIEETGHILDIKTTGDDVYWFPSAVKRFGYDLSAPFYVDIFNENGREIKRYTFAVIEKNPPYGIKLFDMAPEYLAAGRERYLEALSRYKVCLANNHWPCYNNEHIPMLFEDGFKKVNLE